MARPSRDNTCPSPMRSRKAIVPITARRVIKARVTRLASHFQARDAAVMSRVSRTRRPTSATNCV
jgi:hypothetical protein